MNLEMISIPLPLNDKLEIELPEGTKAVRVFIENDVAYLEVMLGTGLPQKRKFITLPEFSPLEKNYRWIGWFKSSVGTFECYEVIDL
mgnify:CR=1 FL=1